MSIKFPSILEIRDTQILKDLDNINLGKNYFEIPVIQQLQMENWLVGPKKYIQAQHMEK